MASSMKAGLCRLPDDCESVMFLLADQPHIPTFMIRQLLERFAQHRAPITAPRVNDRRANPVLFAEETFDALMTVRGDQEVGRYFINLMSIGCHGWMRGCCWMWMSRRMNRLCWMHISLVNVPNNPLLHYPRSSYWRISCPPFPKRVPLCS